MTNELLKSSLTHLEGNPLVNYLCEHGYGRLEVIIENGKVIELRPLVKYRPLTYDPKTTSSTW